MQYKRNSDKCFNFVENSHSQILILPEAFLVSFFVEKLAMELGQLSICEEVLKSQEMPALKY